MGDGWPLWIGVYRQYSSDQHCPTAVRAPTVTGGDCHCAQCGLALPPARLPGWATPIRAPPNLDQHCPAVRSGLLPTVTVLNADQHCPAADLRPTGTVLNVHCPAVSSGPAANWYCAQCGPALPHCCVHACPGGLLQLEPPKSGPALPCC